MLQQNKSKTTNRKKQRYRLAYQYENARRYKEALKIYQQLWNEEPKNYSYYRGVKNSFIHLNRYDEAMVAINNMLQINRTYYVEADVGDIHFKMDKKDKAFEIWNDIIKRNKNKTNAYQAVVNSMMSNRLFDEAIKTYKLGRKNISNNAVFLVELANLYSSRLEYKNATLMYLEYLKFRPKQYEFIEGQLINLAKNIEEVDPIINILNNEIKRKKDSILLRKLLAGLYTRHSRYDQAFNEYKFIDENISDNPALKKDTWGNELFDFGNNALRDGAYQFSEQAFHILLTRYPESPYAVRAEFGLAKSANLQAKYTESINLREFVNDELIQDGVIRNFEIIGEASKKLSNHFREKYTKIPWKKISGMRDILIHDYIGVDITAVWDTIEQDLPKLKEYLLEILKDR
jgi:uncharacterized protein with HEPN domain